MAGSKLTNKDNIPQKSVAEVLEEQEQNRAAKELAKTRFLSDMSQLESSGGRNTDHRLMTGGMHAGERAVGQYGLMPKTIDEMAGRLEKEGELPGDIADMRETLPPQEFAELISKDPDAEQLMADRLYDHVNKRFAGDEEKMSYGWEMGHNTNPRQLSSAAVEAHPRTEKFRKLRAKIVKND